MQGNASHQTVPTADFPALRTTCVTGAISLGWIDLKIGYCGDIGTF